MTIEEVFHQVRLILGFDSSQLALRAHFSLLEFVAGHVEQAVVDESLYDGLLVGRVQQRMVKVRNDVELLSDVVEANVLETQDHLAIELLRFVLVLSGLAFDSNHALYVN